MQALTAEELAGFRADLGAMLPERCAIERDASQDSGATDPYGHPLPADWQPHLAEVPCSYWQADSATSVEPAEVVVTSHRLAVPHGTDVRPSDRVAVVLGADGLARTERPLRVDGLLARESHVELRLTEVAW